MGTLITLLVPFLLGLVLRQQVPEVWQRRLHRANFYLLQLLLLTLFATQGWNLALLPLLLAGVLLQALPATYAALRYRRGDDASAWLIFSTYGGGNRGVLLLGLAYPAALRDFMVVDLGNFLSLVILLPLLQRWACIGAAAPGGWGARLSPLWAPLSAIALGLALRLAPELTTHVPTLATLTKQLLGVGIALHLGLQFHFQGLALRRLPFDWLRVRLPSVGLAALTASGLLLALGRTPGIEPLVAILVFTLLPVSSLLPGLCAEAGLARRATQAVVASSLLFLLLLPLVTLFSTLASGQGGW